MYSQVGGVSRMVMRWCREWSHSFTLEGTPKRRDVEELLAVTMRNRAMEADIQLGVNDKAARNPSPLPLRLLSTSFCSPFCKFPWLSTLSARKSLKQST